VALPFDLERTGNLVEAGFWIVLGVFIGLGARRRSRALATLGLVSGTILVLFGVSDLVEAQTGAWWRPRWLLVWKGLCLAGMVLCILEYRRVGSRAPDALGSGSPGCARARGGDGAATMEQQCFETIYQGQAPWDIDGPQPDVVRLEESGLIQGSVLDAGCGTGENALYLASRGHEVWGLDFVPAAIDRAREKAARRGIEARFQAGDALELDRLGRTFDTVIDCGLFHTFGDDERPRYVRGLMAVLRPGGAAHILCFSDQEPPGEGPRRISQQELRETFRDGWAVEQIRPSQFETAKFPGAPQFSPGGPHAWVATIRRTDSGSGSSTSVKS
jgi:SAM-dependent methyltransferase